MAVDRNKRADTVKERTRTPSPDDSSQSPDEILDQLLANSRMTIDISDLTHTARNVFDLIQRWSTLKPSPRPPEISIARSFIAAIDSSIKTAYRGIVFANDFVELCGVIQVKSAADVSRFIDEMRDVGQAAHEDAQETYRKFRAVREALVQVIKLTEATQDPGNLQNRDIVKLLHDAKNNVDKMVQTVNDFTRWWHSTTALIFSLKDDIALADGFSAVRLEGAREGWKEVRERYNRYRFEIHMLQDYYPLSATKAPRPWYRWWSESAESMFSSVYTFWRGILGFDGSH